MNGALRQRLIALAAEPTGDSIAMAGILSARCGDSSCEPQNALGLDASETGRLLGRFFPALLAGWTPGACVRRHVGDVLGLPHICLRDRPKPDHGGFSRGLLQNEAGDLARLLLSHADHEDETSVWFARLIAQACLESDHLWQCLGLSGRAELDGILQRHFPSLFAKNANDMRWKKFLYKQLCDVEKVWSCKADSCRACPHEKECFGPEE
jgi:nitrogen fixation protein NifQ